MVGKKVVLHLNSSETLDFIAAATFEAINSCIVFWPNCSQGIKIGRKTFGHVTFPNAPAYCSFVALRLVPNIPLIPI